MTHSAAAVGASSSDASASSAPSPFRQLVDDAIDAKLAYEPSLGTALGLHEHDVRLEDLSRARIESRIAELTRLAARLDELHRSALDFQAAIDAQALGGMLASDLQELADLRPWVNNPMFYARLPASSIDGLLKRNFAPPKQRSSSVIARLQRVPSVYAAARENLDNPPREFTELALRAAKGSVAFFATSLPTWAEQVKDADPALFEVLAQTNAAALAATREFAEWLERDLLPRSKGDYALGATRFLAKLKHDEMIELPLPELLARGEAQLEKDRALFISTARQIDPTRSAVEVSAALAEEHPTADNLIPSVRRSLEAARQFVVDHHVLTLPSEVRPLVEETPRYARVGTFASMDTPGPFEAKAAEAYYYVTPVEPDWDAKHRDEHLRLFSPYGIAMINVHEAFPGHYVQFLYAPRLPSKLRQVYGVGSNAEGWAHYAEQMMVEEGFGGGNPKYQLAQLHEALLRDCRYVAAIKLHTEGWTVERAAKLFVERCFQEPANGLEEARRGAWNPTYLYYTLGKLEIYALRRDYLEKTGETLAQFHDAFLKEGALPIPLVRRLLLERPSTASASAR